MLDKIEMSLDDIIKQTKGPRQGGGSNRRNGAPNNRRGGGRQNNGGNNRVNKGPGIRRAGPNTGRIQKRNGGRNNIGGGGGGAKFSRGDVNSTWTHDLFDGPRNRGGGGGMGGNAGIGTTKLLISNLEYGVSESDVKELFTEFGNLKSSSIHYDKSGRSLGTADIVFERRSDALKAMKTYHGVPLDGRPMNIQLATSEVPQSRPAAGRLGVRNAQRNTNQRGGGGGGPRRQGGNNGPRNGGGRAPRRQAPTAEELDAELDAYAKDMK